MSRLTNRDLKNFFRVMNNRFFNGEISQRYTVRFKRMKDDGLHIPSNREIFINEDFRAHGDVAWVILVHEMAHAALHPSYIGHKHDGGHGTRFHAKIDELYKLGAYDGLL